MLYEIHPRNATISWSPPSRSNGILTNYNVYQNSQLIITVHANTTSLTLSNLAPYQHYFIEVEACTEMGCTLSTNSHTLHTPAAPPEGVISPQLYSDTPTSVLVTWAPPLHPNGPLESYVLERRVNGSQQISKVANMMPNQTLTYLDNSASLSPWSTYEYRVIATTRQGGSNSSQWEKVTTRPSRPAGIQPPKVLVLGPESVQVTWSDPLFPNGEIERYEIRMPDPRISHTDTSALNCTISGLKPYTNYNVTILTCSGGGGFVGGCTESLPTPVTTLPTIPQGVPALLVIAISESFLTVSWHPPTRPNGPKIRYKLLRRKTQQPLASRPPEDFNHWYHVYAGDKLFHEDKGLSRYTWYEYKLLVYNDVGYASGEVFSGVTLAGPPLHATNVSAQTINHTAILLQWTTPTLQDLQGKVELYFLTVTSIKESQRLRLDPSVTSVLISDLQPNTEYTLSLTASNGAHNITSPEVTCTTADGEPEGVFPPEIVILNSTSVRVLWAAPLVPNGAVTHYSIYLDGQLYTSTDNMSGSLELGGLQPFTVYDVQVEVCTVYACVKSNNTKLTTVEDTPADIAAPTIRLLSSRSIRLEWSSPAQPNGILRGYNIHRKALKPCEELQAKQATLSSTRCSYLQCPMNQDFCGNSCYQPEEQVCCENTIYSFKESHLCCDEHYLPAVNLSMSVCCGGNLHRFLPQHQCCGDYYIPIRPGEVCCPDQGNLRVSVGLGDACCGSMPFSSTAGQICCNGSLHDGYGSQCCGGKLVSKEVVCCGDPHKGTAHPLVPGMACCGEQYINTSMMLCCVGPDQEARAHVLENRTASVKCCGTEVMEQDEECCNGIGFDPDVAVCADRAPHDSIIMEKCRPSALCPASTASRAYCGVCDFNPNLYTCTRVLSEPDMPSSTESSSSSPKTLQPSEPAHARLCPTAEEIIYSADPNTYYFTDTNLEPYTMYEYRVYAWNRGGHGFSLPSWVTTKEDVPQGVLPPRWSRVGLRDDIILLNWSSPIQTNGEISHYVVLRDGRERYRGIVRSFTDAGGIRPFHEYTYQLRACTTAGCTDSPKVVAVTVQGVPEGVGSPAVSALGPKILHITWEAPSKPNGIIREYRLNQTGVGLIHTHAHGEMEHTVQGLQPYTNYTFVLTACTVAGCGASKPSMGRTLQDAPEGIWTIPRHVVVNSTAVDLYWCQPSRPNGLLKRYHLLRDGVSVYDSSPNETKHTDTNLQPNTRYVYELEASTDAGSSVSSQYIIQTPVSTPEKIPTPYNVSVLGPRSVFVSWSLPGVYNSSLPLDYSVMLNAGTERPLSRSAGPHQSLLLDGLDPYTTYEIRVQACQADGCGVGEGISVQTSEAVPKALDPPELRATGAAVTEVHWSPPRKPNGLIKAYFLYRRLRGTQEELLVFIWSEGPLEFIDASDFLKPFSEYEYRITAHNSQGSTSSSWSFILTLEAEPEGMDMPTAWPTGAYSIFLNWTQPSNPNGIISKYKVVYKQQFRDPTLNSSSVTALTVAGDVHQAHVFGLEPYTTYTVCVDAVNRAGSVCSPWATIQTLQASPTGLANFSVEKRECGRTLLLHWPEPASPNGVIKTYNIYSDGNLEFSGLSRQFLFRRLEPYTTYVLVLEACTEAGCTRTVPQPITTEEAPPTSQQPPSAQFIGSKRVELHWVPPGQANGKILQYQVLALKSDEDETEQAKVVCTESDVLAHSFSCNVSDLKPWSRYKFQVQVSNMVGSTNSRWLTVQTKQAPPSGLAAPTVSHLEGHPNELFVNWRPPSEANGVLLSYRIQRDDVSFHFSFESSVLNYTDEDLTAYTNYSYAVIACTVAGCVTSQSTTVRTLEAAPAIVEPPIVSNVTSHSLYASWTVPSIQNGEIVEYILQINNKEVYHGKKLSVQVSNLQPHTQYSLILTACTNGGCTTSLPTSTITKEAPPTSMPVPILKVTGPESVEVSWKEPDQPNGVITGYELRRDGHLIYTGMDTRYHDFMLLPSIEYSYTVTANNSQGTATSIAALAHTQPSVPSGVTPPQLQALGPLSVLVQWDPPARANGVIISYSLYTRDPAEPNTKRVIFAPHHSAFQSRSFSLTALKPYHRYEVRVEACTLLGCAASDWSSIQTQEVPPNGQSTPLLELQSDSKGMQNIFFLSWSPPAQANGKILHYELYRRLGEETGSRSTLVYCNISTSYRDHKLQPYTSYEYQVWAVNSAGRTGSPWTMCRTGPAPPEGVSPPTFLHIRATSAVVNIRPPANPNGIVTIYRVFDQKKDSHLLLSEGTSRQQTLHGLMPFTTYSVRVEACTCFLCCSRGPVSEFRTHASVPSQQPPPRLITLTSHSALLEWDEPLQPNGIIESCELLVRTACPQPLQPVPSPCSIGTVETRFFGKGLSLNVTALHPYTTYEVCVVSYNNMGSTASVWISITTLIEAPVYKEPFVVQSNLTTMFVDWSGSFSLNGPLREYILTESSLRIYSGFHSSIYIPWTSVKTFAFQVICTTDNGSVSSPVIKYNTATGLDTTEPTSGGKTGLYASGYRFYTELWFIILMAFVGLLLVALLLGLVLRRALKKPSFSRERAPLQSLQRRSSKYPPNDSYMGLTDTKLGINNCGYQSNMSVLHVSSQSQNSHAYSHNSLHRSVSQLIDLQDKKSLPGLTWDTELQGTDNGMFAGDEEFADSLKGFSSVKKEHAVFTDTPL